VDATRIEERASHLLGDARECRREAGALSFRVVELGRDRAARRRDRRRRDDENRRHRHPRFDRRTADGGDQSGDALRRVPRGVIVHRLEVVGAEHEDDQGQRRVDLDALREPMRPLRPGL
jgi:hypothetical protein